MSADLALRCRACDAALLADDRFCEACGAAVSNPRRAQTDLSSAAAVSEQGRSHRRNEDAFALERIGDGVAAVVCDGISTAASGDAAARAAADAALAVLVRALQEETNLDVATSAAVLAAHDAVQRVPATTRNALALPSCTLVSAACRDGEVVVGWVGDSRAYWTSAGDARQLTVDDSWATEQVADGVLSSEEAFADRRAHAITRWVGPDAPPDVPGLSTLVAPCAGRLVLCTDGLWNEVADIAEIADDPDATAAAVAHRLVDAAMARGARDDVTVAVIDIREPGAPQP